MRKKNGVTLVEILLSVALLSVVILAIFSLYGSTREFYFETNNEIIISYELGYVVQHIYKNAMRAIGDTTTSAISDPNGGDSVTMRINTNDPLTMANYGAVTIYTYSKVGNTIMFDDGGGSPESLAPKISIDYVSFDLDSNLLTIELEGSYGGRSVRFYSACYPRFASFN